MTVAVKWYKSLSFQGLVGLGFITFWLFTGIVLVMNTRGKNLLSNESSRLIEITGNNAVSELNARSLEIAALTRTLAATAEKLPKSETTFKKIIPKIIDFQGDLAVAGGGIWPEPYTFQADKQRRSFFWGRDLSGNLKYYDDYNQSGLGYHHEEWYVPVRYTKSNTCFWSKSYIDPYSYQPMVTCTVPTFEQGKFSGAATIDLKLEGLQAFAQSLQKETGGYVFILDRNNKFITLPQSNKNRQSNTKKFIFTSELAAKQPLFVPLAKAVTEMNATILSKVRHLPTYTAKVPRSIDSDSYQIEEAEAELIYAAIADPFKESQSQTRLYNKVYLDNDFLLKEASTAFIFHVPGSYWKLVIVKPIAEINSVANNITKLLSLYLLATIVIIMITAYIILNRFLIKPLLQTTNNIKRMGKLVADKKVYQMNKLPVKHKNFNEISLLSQVFNILATEVVDQHHQLEQANEELEVKVKERTTQLAQANTEIIALNERLKTENLRMSAELAIARQLQQMILPKQHELNQIEGLEIASFMQSADEVGGDYYDVLNCNGLVKIGIGDVTGHGLESGVLMIMVQTAIRTLLENNQTDPVNFLNALNRTIYHNIQRMNIDKNMSLTLLDYADGKLQLSGQHEEIIIVRANGIQRIDTIDLGFPIGLEPDISAFVASKEILLFSGDIVVLYTDGITEAENNSKVQYGLERLCKIVSCNKERSPEEIKQAVINDLLKHIGSAKVYDDITLLILKQK